MLRAEMAQIVEEILAYRCPRYEQLPDMPLYSDQVVDTLNRYTAPFDSEGGEQAITATMINNYVKQRLIEPPVKKRYDREQVARLYCICLLKRVFSIAEVKRLMEVQMCSYPFPQAYDYFCVELEKALFRGDFDLAAAHILPVLLYSVGITALAVCCFLGQMKKQ